MSDATARRRWLTLAEIVALIGLVVAALGLWNSWQDRRDTKAVRAATDAVNAHEASRVDLAATPRDGGRELLLRDPRHDIQDVTIAFPRALGITAQHPLADPVVDGDPVREALLDGTDARQGRLPVLITTRVVDGDAAATASAIYDVVWTVERKFPFGRSLKLAGLRLHQRGGDQATLDAVWAREKPAPKS